MRRISKIILPALLLLALCCACFTSCGSDESAILSVYNYPNPCTPAQGTTLALRYDSPAAGDMGVYIYVYDLAGAPVMIRYLTVVISAGDHTYPIPWDVTNDRGNALAPGVYIFKATTEGLPNSIAAQSASHKLMVQ
jgi:hypothetical protein